MDQFAHLELLVVLNWDNALDFEIETEACFVTATIRLCSSGAFPPEFAGPITNLTVPVGRDATLTCLVKHLGGYRIGWLKVDTKAIQAIHEHVITHNTRVSVSHSDHTMWNLHIKSVQPEDEGLYMCQINTDPMKSQTGMLSIVVPPDFIPEETSSDVMVREGGQVKLTCHAKGVPPPRISWRREDGKNIIIRKPFAGSALNQMSHEMSGSAKTQTAARPSFYDEEDETVYGSAEIEKMENKLLPVDNTHNGHMRYPSIATSVPTVRVNKKRAKTVASSNADCHLPTDLLVIPMLIVAHRRYQ
ncbi:Lachesin [Eufriesea mexicana]|uniref:Lachesin n=1 Tax=Eufriesea mexicana TaxID=516756 RepID=A0A310SNJ7_9HYME|nr:Lachesin [Eufriesea mexicana]